MKFINWKVATSRKVEKLIDKLPPDISDLFEALKVELQINGRPSEGWPRVGKIWEHGKRNEYKIHLNSNRPVYVVTFEINAKEREVKVNYAGSHEKAPYGR